ncbi:MAG: M1 family metallopeptidase [Clostridia bacterium]|nr:M1 family metallopeptidase [Clostridia bacterium]
MKKSLFFLTMLVIVFFYADYFRGIYQPKPTLSLAQQAGVDTREFVSPEYCFDLIIEDRETVSARLNIKYFNNLSYPLDEIKMILPANLLSGEKYIELHQLNVKGRSFTYQKNDQSFIVTLAQSLMPGEGLEIETRFHTSLPCCPDKFGYYQDALRLSNWYPVIAPFDREEKKWVCFKELPFGDPYYYEAALFKGRVQAPSGWQVISPFVSGSDQTQDNFLIDSHFPARDCTFVIGTGFHQVRQEVDSIQVEYYFQKHNRDFAPHGADVLKFYQSLLGNYPYSRLVLVDLPLSNYLGMEFSGMVFLSTSYPQVGIQTLAHEIAHQYWYGLVGSNQIKEPWVDEGLASYSALLYLEEKYGGESYCQAIKEINREGNFLSFFPISAYPNREVYKEAVYKGPALFWDRLRHLAGRESLCQVFQRVQIDYKFQIINGEELFHVLKKAYGLNNHQLRRLLFGE